MSRKLYPVIVLFAAALAAFVWGCSKSDNEKVSVSDWALEEDVVDCQTASRECLVTAGSISGIQACRTAFTTCLEEAAGIVDDAQEDIAACREEARTCISEAKDGAAVARCRNKEAQCVAKLTPDATVPNIPDRPQRPDGGIINPPDIDLPGVDCLTTMNECVTAGEKDMFECAADARDCMLESLPDLTIPTIPGLPTLDGGLNIPTIPGLDDLPGADCIQKMRQCVRDGEKDPMTCANEARICMLPDIPDGGIVINRPTRDGGFSLPGAQCRQSLRECLRAGTEPAKCAADARACVRQEPTDTTE